MVPPEDVAELAQSTGIPIYMISTREAKLEPVSTVVFERMTAATGGKAYFANSWRDERRAFASIRDDLGHLYSVSYYPAPNPNRGWRAINVRLVRRTCQEISRTHPERLSAQTNRFSSEAADLLGIATDAVPEIAIRTGGPRCPAGALILSLSGEDRRRISTVSMLDSPPVNRF